MPSTIKIRRGLEANRTAVTPAAGEFLFTTDNKKVFIGDGSTAGGIGVGGAVAFEQSIKSVDYTLVLQDAGKQIFHPASDIVVRTYTIPANSAVPFPIGTVLQFAVDPSGVDVNIAINDDTLVLGSGVTGTIRLDPGNILTAIKITSTKWLANYEYQYPYVTPQFVAVSEINTGLKVDLYSWTSADGFGTRYPTPATAVNSAHNDVKIAPNGSAIAAAFASSPYIAVWALSSAGYGAKFANPATLPSGIGNAVAWHPEMTAIAVAHATTPFVTAYPWSAAGFGVQYANPGTLPASNGNAVKFSPAGDVIFVGNGASPFILAYAWNSTTGFGTKYSDPATLPGSTVTDVALNPAGDAVAVSFSSFGPYIHVYPWNSSTGFGSKFANPATLPASSANAVAFNPAGTSIAIAHQTSPFVSVYPWSVSGFGTKYGNAGGSPIASTGRGVTFSADAIFTSEDTTPFIRAWRWDATTGFGTAYNSPATLPGVSTRKMDYNFG